MRREGAAAARAVFTPVVEEYRSAGPLDVVQIDHTIVDLIVVDEVTRTPIGRPVLTLAIDIHTRVVTGFYLGLDHPSYVDGSRLQGFLSRLWRLGRVRSYVRPFDAAHTAAGPHGVRGSGPYQKHALRCALRDPGLPDPRLDRFAMTSSSPSQRCGIARPFQAACPTNFSLG